MQCTFARPTHPFDLDDGFSRLELVGRPELHILLVLERAGAVKFRVDGSAGTLTERNPGVRAGESWERRHGGSLSKVLEELSKSASERLSRESA
jgi:hypothetical protein